MTGILQLRQQIKVFVGRNEVYLKPILKLIIALTSILVINNKLGYMQKINSVPIALIVSLMCSFMPMNFIVLICAVFILLHVYALSLECAAIVLIMFVILFLLYFRFSPKDTITVVLTPILSVMGIPYIMPVTMGLIGTPASAVSLGCGVIVTRVLKVISDNAATLSAMETEDMAAKIRLIIDGILADKLMIVLIGAFAVTVIIVYIIRRLPIDFGWSIAIVGGAIIDAVVVLIGKLATDADISVAGIIFGTILAMVVGFIIQFFIFNLDYQRTEKVQFEDDDYYYYVKAVPKVSVSMPSKTVKRINSAKRRPPVSQQQRANNIPEE